MNLHLEQQVSLAPNLQKHADDLVPPRERMRHVRVTQPRPGHVLGHECKPAVLTYRQT